MDRLLLASLLASLLAGCGTVEESRERALLGGTVRASVTATGPRELAAIFEDVEQGWGRIGRLLDGADPESALARLNATAPDTPFAIEDREMWLCLRLALDWAEATDGAYDPTAAPLTALFRRPAGRLPSRAELAGIAERVGWQRLVTYPEAQAVRFLRPGMRVDFDELGRGFALDVAKRALSLPGARAALLQSGATFYAWSRDHEAQWVPLVEPDEPDEEFGSVALAGRGLSVAGSFRRLLDAEARGRAYVDTRIAGPAASDVLAAVAVADAAGDAAAIAEALLVMGSQRAADLVGRARRVEAVLLVRGQEGDHLYASATLRERVRFSPELLAAVDGAPRFLLPPASLDARSLFR